MQSWLPDLSHRAGPKYAAISAAIERAIHSGELRPGERLPSQRDLAEALGVDLTTVTHAYGTLRENGLIEGAGRLGSFVRNDAVAPRFGETSTDTGMNMPPQPGFALLADAIRSGTNALLRAGGHSPLLQYQPSGGNVHDRTEAAEALARRGIASSADQMVITAGGQNALHALFSAVLARGDRLCTGRHAYPGMLALAARFGIELVAVPDDAEGIDPDALAGALRTGARALYLTPTNDNPTTATLGVECRRAIVDLARRHGVLLIEDDAYGRLPEKPLPTLAHLAPELTWHIASTSKIISPVLRVAFVRAPSARDAWAVAADVHETAVMAPPLYAALVTHWLRDGTFDALVAGVRAEAVARQRIATRQLAGLDFAAHPEGYHLWLRLGRTITAAELAAAVSPMGLSIVPGEAFAVRQGDGAGAVRISIGGAIDHDRLRHALERVSILIQRSGLRRGVLI